ncbi:hypothetical protein [Pseudonocardia acidicola]|uniref:Uncharacterized protein n=1 Tax=Pseudonocardia acidicola TaxID=2724939 RepID=A0ABX1S8R8_9PSEU|nr:hypothetical protein [Pseudonocardia acidicola]NMH96553.1 hypothetical protein [Pseudonocardia acidicola]
MADGFRIAEAFVEVTVDDRTEAGTAAIRARLDNIRTTAKLDADIAAADAKLEQEK